MSDNRSPVLVEPRPLCPSCRYAAQSDRGCPKYPFLETVANLLTAANVLSMMLIVGCDRYEPALGLFRGKSYVS